MDKNTLLQLAKDIIAGNAPEIETCKTLASIPEHDAFTLLPGADMIRNHYFGKTVHLCNICNGKSGRCTENCTFCSQSKFSQTDVPVYPLLSKEKLQEGALYAAEAPVNRYSIVTSGKRLSKKEVEAVAEAFSELDSDKVSYCASLGILDQEDFETLKAAGVSRYHHNLETAESFFKNICNTHTYQERVDTIMAAKAAGLSVCAGGIFGIGETDLQILELALALRDLDVDAVPINFLVPIKGTPLENHSGLTPLRCLKIIALFRYILPNKDIFICGGRTANLKSLHPMVFYAGASGIMTGNYLTTTGQTLQQDLEIVDQLGFTTK
ncbi:biotin synthase BioB [Desulfonema magnum]|uniref:Biotin synthase n=1 Tax=Desulfonema magnum TaxID=45655 RepID=A0A975GN90_9BACT|nr:biotin synthase BioB [Desulfonema magnum]QTA87525.1 Biotin synthase [Desulfonema magnum]